MLKEEMNTDAQRMFTDSFAKNLMSDPDRDFVIDVVDVLPFLGFSGKDKAKDCIMRHLKLNVHYKIEKKDTLGHAPRSEQVSGTSCSTHGGHNRERIMLTVSGFKHLCMVAGTAQAMKVREYYLTMEKVVFMYLQSQNRPMAREPRLIRSDINTVELKNVEDIMGLELPHTFETVSYTHLTLPTKRIV